MKLISAAILIIGLAGLATGQSLADLARQQRAERRVTTTNGEKITTESASAPRPGAALSVTGSRTPAAAPAPAPEAAEAAANTTAVASDSDSTEPSSAETPPDTEDAWRSRFADARAEIGRTEQRLALAEADLQDLNSQLLTRSDIYNREYQLAPQIAAREAEIVEIRQHLEESNEALDALREDLRRRGLPSGWGR